jgi:quinol monooxygenase YgiN
MEIIMSETVYIEIPLKPEHATDFSNFCNNGDEAFALTKQQVGFISAEWMISTAENGTTCFHLWEKWESKEDFNTYFQIPERGQGSQFEAAVMNWAAGEPRFCWGQPTIV